MNYKTHIFSVGNSQAVRLPKKLLDFLEYKAGEEVVISAYSERKIILIEKAVPCTYKSIKELFAGYESDGYIPTEWDTGKSFGKETF